MKIETYDKGSSSKFIELAKEVFPEHNIFGKETYEIIDYLEKKNFENRVHGGGVFFAYEGKTLVGGGLLRIVQVSGSHALVKYNHVIGRTDIIKEKIIAFFDTRILKANFQSVKVEVGLSEKETDLEIYEKLGFEIEGKLMSHYRYGEMTYILGKEILG